jgi:glycosyltransferase involved in cell wall biosynthesis
VIVDNVGRGASAARNRATQRASGEFLQYLDADDLLEPHALASRVEALVRAGADVAISDWQRLEDLDGEWRPTGRIESGRLPDAESGADLAIFRGFWAPPAAILYRRSLCERIAGWRGSLPVIQDARYLFDAARLSGRFVHVPGVGAQYRQHRHGSLSSDHAATFWRDVLTNTRDVERLWQHDGLLDQSHYDALAEAYALCTRVGFMHDRPLFEASRRELRRFRSHAPPRFLRAAFLLTRLVGYESARTMLSTIVATTQPAPR